MEARTQNFKSGKVICHIYKVRVVKFYAEVLETRFSRVTDQVVGGMQVVTDQVFGDVQVCFGSGKGCVGQIFTLK